MPRTCLVAGSYPPAPGPAAAATVAAVRRAWAGGLDVVVASPRPSAAPLVMAVSGAAVGRALDKLPRFDVVVVCLEPGWPLGRGRSGRPVPRAELERAARSLAASLSRFERAELVVTGDLGVSAGVLALLWPPVQKVTASSEAVATFLRAAGAPGVSVAEPYAFAGAALMPAAVNPLEPGELLLVARGRRLVGSAARKVLGRRAPAVRAYLQRALSEVRKAAPSKSAR